jgi:3-dehydroquinate dehydratase/shikimate dehydrogenase
MICVSIARGRHRHVIAEHRHLAEQGAKLVELRIDYLEGQVNLKRLLVDRPSPVVVTCRREQDGGKFRGSEATRLMLLRTAVAEGADYVDLEEDVATAIPRYGKTKRIISLHDFRKMPEDLEAIHARLSALDADIVKLAVTANQPHDNLRMLTLVRESRIPTVGLCMGDIGTPSRILAGRFGAPFTFATFHHERTLAPGQLSYAQMTEIYHYDQINAETAIYAVIGDPVAQSLSPVVHNPAFLKAGVNAVYLPFRVPREHLGRFIDEAPQLGIRGLSVTIPHKEAVMSKLTRVDAVARGIGAVNTVLLKDRELIGYNTDEPAAMSALEQALAADGTPATEFHKLTALLLGSGGAAMALAFGLKRRGIDVVIAGRTAKKAQALADRLHCGAIDWNERHNIHADILVNCTPIGMHPNVDATPFEKEHLKATMLVFDTVYNPENTLLIKEARSQGCTVVTGVEMFVRQAALQFKLFTGQEAPTQLMYDELKRAIGPARH